MTFQEERDAMQAAQYQLHCLHRKELTAVQSHREEMIMEARAQTLSLQELARLFKRILAEMKVGL